MSDYLLDGYVGNTTIRTGHSHLCAALLLTFSFCSENPTSSTEHVLHYLSLLVYFLFCVSLFTLLLETQGR